MGKSLNPGDVLFVIALVGITAAGMAISIESPVVIQGDHVGWAVKAGDDLTYEVSGHRDGAPVIGAAYANFTVVNVTAGGDAVGGFFSTDLGNWTGREVESALNPPSMGSCME